MGGRWARSRELLLGRGFHARPAFVMGLLGAGVAWWLSGDPTPPAPAPVVAAPPTPLAIVDTLEPSQTLSEVWLENGLDPAALDDVVQAGEGVVSWRGLRPGAVLRFVLAADGTLERLDLTIDRDRRMVLRRAGTAYRARVVETVFTRRARSIAACIEGSPWETLERAGEDPALTVTMAEVLAAQVDFYSDLQADDCFDLAISVDERPDGSYRLVSLEAVRLRANDDVYEAYRYTPPGQEPDYFDVQGQSLRRRFLRSPLKYTRVSSGFGMRRHPISRRRRHHNGVDYVAPTGTPVQASGDGMVAYSGRRGGYGLHVRLEHAQRYVTTYSHLSRIGSAVRRGAKVRQGEIIGYVGSTGMSTAPHLHYEFMNGGRRVDPLSTDLPTAVPLEGAALAGFEIARDGLRARLGGPSLAATSVVSGLAR